jgi:hypothetical protein
MLMLPGGRPRVVARLVALGALAAGGVVLVLWESSAPAGVTDLVVSITSGPPSQTAATQAMFVWTVKVRGVAGTRCQLDGGPGQPCASPKTYFG